MNFMIFGEKELEEYVQSGAELSSHLISIGNPKKYFGRKNPNQSLSPLLRGRFKEVLRLSFWDLDNVGQLGHMKPAVIPEIKDVHKVIEFYNKTKAAASGHFVHCTRGVSRSTAIALGLLYLDSGSERTACARLKQIRPEAVPLPRIVEFYDKAFGSSLLRFASEMREESLREMQKTFFQEIDELIEEL